MEGIEYKPLKLRDYQQQCVESIMEQPKGSKSLVIMATGLGKTGTFTHLPRESGRTLIVSAGKEIVTNPLQYYEKDFPVGIEMGEFSAKTDFPDAQVVTASIQTIAKPSRLTMFAKDEFQTVIIDEAHHSTADSYKRVIDYFEPERLIGFTATPNRSDGVGLGKVYDKVIFQRDLKWAITKGLLSDIVLRKVKGDFDLRNIRANKANGEAVADFTDADIARVMAGSAPFLAQVYKDYAFGPTIIFVAGKALAYEVAKHIPNAVAITGEMTTSERQLILNAFRDGSIPCLVSVSVLKEGVDLPVCQTIIYARPTLSSLLYTQIVGRGLRLYEGKKYLNLIEVEGILGENVTLISAPSLFGIDLSTIPKKDQDQFNMKRLTEMEDIAAELAQSPESWMLSTKNAQAWADTSGYDIHNMSWLVFPDGHFELSFPKGTSETVIGENGRPYELKHQYRLEIPSPDALGRVVIGHTRMPLQIALDISREYLDNRHSAKRIFWDKDEIFKKWGSKPASDAQKATIKRYAPTMDTGKLTSYEASQFISKMFKSRADADKGVTLLYPIDPEKPPEHFSAVETVVLDRKKFEIYDFDPGTQFKMDVDRAALLRSFTKYLAHVVYDILYLNVCHKNAEELIQLLSRTTRNIFVQKYFKEEATELRYLCSLNGTPVSRMELTNIMAEHADRLLPCIVQARVIDEKDDSVVYARIKPRLKEHPMDMFKFQYAGTRSMLEKKNNRMQELPKTVAELKEADKNRWLSKQQAAKKSGKSRRAKNGHEEN